MQSYEKKLQRAEYHIASGEEALGTWWFKHHGAFSVEQTSGAGEWTFFLEIQDAFPELGLYIGDACHNARSALDHIVYELAVRTTPALTEPQLRSLQFPVGADPVRPLTHQDLQRYLGALPEEAQAFIERSQPYHHPDALSDSAVWIVHELDRVDKHRYLQPAIAMDTGPGAAGENAFIEHMSICDLDLSVIGRVEFAHVTARRIDPVKPMHPHLNRPQTICLPESVLGHRPIFSSLRQAVSDLRRTIFEPFIDEFLS